MSLLVSGTLGNCLTFHEWLLSESVKPLKTEFGLNPPDFNNNDIAELSTGVIGTAFISDNTFYFVQYNKEPGYGGIAFGVSPNIPKTKEEFSKTSITDTRIVSKSFALNIFNKVFYVVLEVLKVLKDNNMSDKIIYFKAANSDLKNIYDAMTKNKFFNQELNNLGYSDLKLVEDKYVTSKL